MEPIPDLFDSKTIMTKSLTSNIMNAYLFSQFELNCLANVLHLVQFRSTEQDLIHLGKIEKSIVDKIYLAANVSPGTSITKSDKNVDKYLELNVPEIRYASMKITSFLEHPSVKPSKDIEFDFVNALKRTRNVLQPYRRITKC